MGRNLISVVVDDAVRYPDDSDYYSPDERYPEYPHRHISGQPNLVYRAVRTCLAQSGLDKEHFGETRWNPLGHYIAPGSRVFVLCNFVYHRRKSENREVFFAKCTHGSVIRAVVDYILIATGENGTVRFGNAPIQSCDWGKVMNDTGASKVERFYEEYTSRRVTACDLRLHKVQTNVLGWFKRVTTQDSGNEEVSIDLGKDSLLDELYAGSVTPRFRLEDYDPRETETHHHLGRHIYRINKRILEADVLFSIPKLKTHARVMVTLGIKGCVGAVSHKVCLAHHRDGPPSKGGDEYADRQFINWIESHISDYVARRQPSFFTNTLRFCAKVLRKLIRITGGTSSGNWSANDTSWRMSLDIARILSHATRAGNLIKETCRDHLLLIDGIIAGEGQGPFSPLLRREGFLLFSDNIVAGDYAASRFMGFDPGKIPLIRRAIGLDKYALTSVQPSELPVIVNCEPNLRMAILDRRVTPFRKPVGW